MPTPTIYDWRYSNAPIDQVFRAGGEDGGGGLTLGGYVSGNPEPGGRGELIMNFNAFATEQANLDASWTISRILNKTVFRVGLYNSVQLVKASAFGDLDPDGNPWANDQPWANGQNWAASPTAPVAASALQGEVFCTVDLSEYGNILQNGHVIGFNAEDLDTAHTVMDISYAEGVATIELAPPLRRDLSVTDVMLFRPKMLVTCSNGREVMGNFQSGRHMTFGTARFVEALL